MFLDMTFFNENYFLPFLTGGVGYSRMKTKVSTQVPRGSLPKTSVTVSRNQTSRVYQFGGGVHIKITNNFFADVLVRYVDLGNAQFGPWLKKLFYGECEVLCIVCHLKKTKQERKRRKKNAR